MLKVVMVTTVLYLFLSFFLSFFVLFTVKEIVSLKIKR